MLELDIDKAYFGSKEAITISRWIMDGNTGIKREEQECLYIPVPEGVDDNEIILMEDRGNILEGQVGDVKVFIKVINKTEFIRQGLDLVLKKQISLREALCGFTFDINHLNGKTFTINNSNGNIIHPGYRKLVPHLGMKRGEHIGNLIINFEIMFPNKLEEEVKVELRNLL